MLKSGFFDSKNGDRRYTSEDMAKMFALLMTNGVYANPTTSLQVVANTNMTVAVSAGFGFINGRYAYNTADYNITLANASGTYGRIDRIVLRLNMTDRQMQLVALTGTPAATPVAPAIIRDGTFYDLSLATISVAKGCTAITQAMITDTRGNNAVCGYVTGAVDQIDTTNLFAQFTDTFNTWFNEIKGQLSEDAAGSLQNQINDINDIVECVPPTHGGTGLNTIGTNGQMLKSNGTGMAWVAPTLEVGECVYSGAPVATNSYMTYTINITLEKDKLYLLRFGGGIDLTQCSYSIIVHKRTQEAADRYYINFSYSSSTVSGTVAVADSSIVFNFSTSTYTLYVGIYKLTI